MKSTRALVVTALSFCAAATLVAQQPGSVTAPAAPKAAVSAAPPPIGIPIDRIVAVVGQKPIMQSEIDEAIYYLQGQGEKIPTDSAGRAAFFMSRVSDMIDQEVLIAVAKQYKAEVDDKEIAPDVDKRIKDIHARFKSEAEFRSALKDQGYGTETELRNSLMETQRRTKLQQMAMDSLKAHGRLAAPVNVTEADVTEAFEESKGKLPRRLATITFKQIIVAPRANPTARFTAKMHADSLLAQLQKGADFEAMAKKESMDPSSKELGGALPWVRRGQMVSEFDRIIFSGMPPGTLAPFSVESSFGFHIIRLDRVQPGQAKSSHILIVPKLDTADVSRTRLVADTVLQKWQKGTPYDSLVKYYHDDTEQKSLPDGYAVDSLPAEYKTAIEGVKKGQLTPVFTIPNPQTGFVKYVIILVSDRVEGGDYTVQDLRDRIRQHLVQGRSERRMLDQLRREQFVKIMM